MLAHCLFHNNTDKLKQCVSASWKSLSTFWIQSRYFVKGEQQWSMKGLILAPACAIIAVCSPQAWPHSLCRGGRWCYLTLFLGRAPTFQKQLLPACPSSLPSIKSLLTFHGIWQLPDPSSSMGLSVQLLASVTSQWRGQLLLRKTNRCMKKNIGQYIVAYTMVIK